MNIKRLHVWSIYTLHIPIQVQMCTIRTACFIEGRVEKEWNAGSSQQTIILRENSLSK